MQDVMVIRLIQIFDKWWIEQGLDLKIFTLKTVPVDDMVGYTQVLENGETLKNICEKYGTGLTSVDKNAVLKYIEAHNKGKAKTAALEIFRRSLAGYCVAGHVLGILERNYGYYVVSEGGRFFQRNFGDQIFGGAKRERTLVAYAKEMEAALYEKDSKTADMPYFLNLCYSAIIILRKKAHQLLNLVSMMQVANIPCFHTEGAIAYIRNQLNLDGNDADACQNVSLE